MKTELQEASICFKPITLSVVFESQEELDSFIICSAHNISIPLFLTDEREVDYSVAQKFGQQLECLRKPLLSMFSAEASNAY